VHHSDYLNRRDGHALCGAALQDAAQLSEPVAADAICPDCELKLVVYHLEWWRERALAATDELEALRLKYGEPAPSADADSPPVDAAEAQPTPAEAEPAPAVASTFLDHARRELTNLCRQFDGAVPYFRLKNAMQDFNDKLDDHDRMLLAQEVASSGSLIRWATVEVESLGLSITNNRVQENSEMTWEEWLQESKQAPTKTKRRFGRSR